MRWPKYWSFSFSIIPSKEIPGLISFRMDWLGSSCCPRDSQESSPTPQFKSINSLVLSLLHSPTLTSTGKTIALTRWTLVGKIMSLLLNMLSRLVITFLPKRKHLLISWLQSPSSVILDYAKAFDCVNHYKLWKILKEMGIPDHLSCLLRNLYAGREAMRTGHGTTDWFQIGKGVHQGYIL